MKRIVYKYPMKAATMRAPFGWVLLVAPQGDSDWPTLWIEHWDKAEDGRDYNIETQYVIEGTGQAYEQDQYKEHVGSCICGLYVWHVFRYSVTP